MPISVSDFKFVCDLIHKRAGIVLEAGKEYLVESRLSVLARKEGLESIEALVARLRGGDALRIASAVEAMTTNETSFLRDLHPFMALRQSILPALVRARPEKRLSIWCAASSAGQEPYTIAMMLHEAIPNIGAWDIKFLATDLSREMIERSRAGRYQQQEVNRGLPAALLMKYFTKQGVEWQVNEPLRRMIEFREMNLTAPWPTLPTCDLIFIRNVLIYFDQPTKADILNKTRRLLRPDGTLFLGGAESTVGLVDAYERLTIEKCVCYQLRGALAKAA